MGALHTQSTNTSVTLGDRLFLKCYRRLRAGVHPELEVGRFLTDKARVKNRVPLAGYVEYFGRESEPTTVALLQAYIPNQGDAWGYTLGYLERMIEKLRDEETHGAYPVSYTHLTLPTSDLV